MFKFKLNCEICDVDLFLDLMKVCICIYECMFCFDCVDGFL